MFNSFTVLSPSMTLALTVLVASVIFLLKILIDLESLLEILSMMDHYQELSLNIKGKVLTVLLTGGTLASKVL